MPEETDPIRIVIGVTCGGSGKLRARTRAEHLHVRRRLGCLALPDGEPLSSTLRADDRAAWSALSPQSVRQAHILCGTVLVVVDQNALECQFLPCPSRGSFWSD
jgi:hypothetical protein